jgi:ankyrin repeat protein
MDVLCEQGTVGGIKSALKELPGNESGAFAASIRQIARKEKDKRFERGLAKHVLTWVMHAKEPLAPDLIKESFAVQYSKRRLNKDYVLAEVDWTSVCAGLVVMDIETQVLCLVHESAGKYLLEQDIIPRQADLDMAKTCLKYLLFDKSGEYTKRPLFKYAAKHWATHFLLGGQDDVQTAELALEFLRNSVKDKQAFQAMAGTDGSAFDGITGLHAATYFNLQGLAKRLIDEGVDINASCSNKQTALHWAVQYNRPALVELLLQQETIDPNLQDENGDTPLHVAVIWSMENSDSIVDKLVTGKARLDIRGGKGFTPLSWAIRYGPLSITKILINSLVDVNAESCEGWSPLRQAMFYSPSDIVDLLLRKGADLNRPSVVDGWTPLRHAVEWKNVQMVQRLLSRKSHPVNVNAKFDNGSNSLLEAVKGQNRYIVWMLLERRAELDHRDGNGKTALHHAIELEDRSIKWLLVTKNASLIPRDKHGLNVLDWAIEHNDLSMAWLLCESGANIDAVNEKGMTVLHRASGRGLLEAVRFLLGRQASMDPEDENGWTPLHYAVMEGHESIVKLLVSMGAKVDIQDKGRQTALHHVVLATVEDVPRASMIGLLLQAGASREVLDNQERTPLMLAAHLGRDNIAYQRLRQRE